MPIVTIKTVEGLLTKEKKRTLHKRITDLLVEIEGNSKPEFAGFVIVHIKEEPAENFSGWTQTQPVERVARKPKFGEGPFLLDSQGILFGYSNSITLSNVPLLTSFD